MALWANLCVSEYQLARISHKVRQLQVRRAGSLAIYEYAELFSSLFN